ncbi:hypothetical protein C8R47DRAFT_1099405 [Mycena vitilis]|nr:hypothetical protein C8R47DRAFT_1099405 [Mycena vitilis]
MWIVRTIARRYMCLKVLNHRTTRSPSDYARIVSRGYKDQCRLLGLRVATMLSVLSTFLLVASMVRSLPTTVAASKRDFTDILYQGSGPQPWNTLNFDARSLTADQGKWFRDDAHADVGVAVTPGNQIGWRLTNDTNTEIVFYWPENPVFLTASYNGSDANMPTFQNFAIVGEATFPTSSNNNASECVDETIWKNSTGGAVVPWTYSIFVTNGCDNVDHRVMVVTTADATGNGTTISGRGTLNMALPTLPVNVTVYFEDTPADMTNVSYFPTNTLTYKVGAGPNQPTVPPGKFSSAIFWCDTD